MAAALLDDKTSQLTATIGSEKVEVSLPTCATDEVLRIYRVVRVEIGYIDAWNERSGSAKKMTHLGETHFNKLNFNYVQIQNGLKKLRLWFV